MFEISYPLTQTDGKYQFNIIQKIYIKHILCAKFLCLHNRVYKRMKSMVL